MMTRRGVVAGLAGLGGIGAFVGWDFAHSTKEDGVATILYKRLDYLTLDPVGVRQFAQDYVKNMATQISGEKLREVAALGMIYRLLDPSPDNIVSRITRFGEDRIVTRYLLSSDFFLLGSDERRTVRYLNFFDALRACSNPFARPVVTDAQTSESA